MNTTIPFSSSDSILCLFDPFQQFITLDTSVKVASAFNRINGQILSSSSASQRPAWNASGINGLPTFSFSGGQSLKMDFSSPVLTGANVPFSITLVAQFSSTSSGQTVVSFGSKTLANPEAAFQLGALTQFFGLRFDDAALSEDFVGVAADTKPHVFTFTFDGTNIVLRVDKKAPAIVSSTQGTETGVMTVDQIVLGNDTDGVVSSFGNEFFSGQLGQVIIYKGGITNLAVETFLMNYYRLSVG